MAIEDAYVLGRELSRAGATRVCGDPARGVGGHCHTSTLPSLLTPLRVRVLPLRFAAGASGGEQSNIPLALKRYNKNRVLRAAAVQGMSRLSSAILFQYNHPTELEMDGWVPKLRNTAPKSVITRAGQGFLQHVAFPLQFEFLFDFPGGLGGGAFRRCLGSAPVILNSLNPSRPRCDA